MGKESWNKAMNNKNGNDHKNMIERVWNKLEHVSNTIDKYGDQMQSQLSHSNAIQSYLNKTQQEIVKVESERYALYQYIQSIKYPHNTVSFVINKLQKEMGFDVSKKTSIDPNIFKTLQAENDSLNRTLNSM